MLGIGSIVKWTAMLGIVTALIGAGGWVVLEIMEKGRLESELKDANGTIELLGVAMAEKDKREVELYNKRLEHEDDARKTKQKFNLSAIEKLAKTDPARVVQLFTTNTDIVFTEFEGKTRSFQRRDKQNAQVSVND